MLDFDLEFPIVSFGGVVDLPNAFFIRAYDSESRVNSQTFMVGNAGSTVNCDRSIRDRLARFVSNDTTNLDAFGQRNTQILRRYIAVLDRAFFPADVHRNIAVTADPDSKNVIRLWQLDRRDTLVIRVVKTVGWESNIVGVFG